MTNNNKEHKHWRLEDIDFGKVDRDLIKDDEMMFYALACASFVEILAELYSDNLIEHFRGNQEVCNWLEQYWQHEELQHGRALKAYVKAVWPDFDWERAHASFVVEYSALCTSEQLETVRSLEMVARCVVETGTTTMYRAFHHYVKEPVLLQLLNNIRTDEASHYAHFRDYFESYNQRERLGTWAVMGAIWRRIREIGNEDSFIAFKHVYAGRFPGQPFDKSAWQHYNKTIRAYARHHYSFSMAIKMILKVVPMARPVKIVVQRSLLGLARIASLN